MSDYKTILVHHDAGEIAPARLAIAFELAATFDAHVAALYAVSATPEPSYAFEGMQVIREAQERMRSDMMAAAHRTYDECVRRTGWQKCEWRATHGDALAAVTQNARYADLVVIGQQDPERQSGVNKDFERSLPLAAGRPVLVVPYAFEHRPIGRHVLVAWNASREAARAVTDSLPLLKRANHVHVVALRPETGYGAHGEEPGADIGLFLTRHGVKVTIARYDAPEVDIGNLLLSRAFDLSTDLIVMGAWGHSRLRELVLGGVTRTLLDSMTVPVLMAH